MFTDVLREETAHHGVSAIVVDTTMTEDDLVDRVTDAFGLRGTTASDPAA
jgi:hypothetical protein